MNEDLELDLSINTAYRERGEGLEPIAIPIKPVESVEDLKAEDVGKLVRFKAMVVSVERGKVFLSKAKWECNYCETMMQNFPSMLEKAKPPLICIKCGRKEFSLLPNYSIYSPKIEIEVTAPLESGRETSRFQHTPIMVYYSPKQNKSLFHGGLVEVVGWIIAESVARRNNESKIVVIAEKIFPSQAYFEEFKPSLEELQQFEKHFSVASVEELFEKDDKTIAPWIRGRQLSKVMADIVLHTPLYEGNTVSTREVLFYGDARTGKSEIIRDSTENLSPLGCEMVNGETASRTGITYNIDAENRKLYFGVLPKSDCMAVGLDAMHSWSGETLVQLREVLATRRVKVDRMLKGDAFARVRIIAASNPPSKRAIDSFPTKYHAIKDFASNIDLARWPFVVVFQGDDVSSEVIDEEHEKLSKAKETSREIPEELFRKHINYSWKRRPIQFEDGVEKDFIQRLRLLQKEVAKNPKLFFHNDYSKFCLHLLAGVSARCNSFMQTEGYAESVLIVKRQHADFLLEILRLLYENNELSKAAETITQTEFGDIEVLVAEINSSTNKKELLLYLSGQGETAQKDLADHFKFTKSYVSQTIGELRNSGLVERQGKGERLTAKGGRVLKELYQKTAKQTELEDGQNE